LGTYSLKEGKIGGKGKGGRGKIRFLRVCGGHYRRKTTGEPCHRNECPVAQGKEPSRRQFVGRKKKGGL